MRTTVEIADPLLVQAKKFAIDSNLTLRELIDRALRNELGITEPKPDATIEWVTSPGGLPPGWDITSRERMHELISGDPS